MKTHREISRVSVLPVPSCPPRKKSTANSTGPQTPGDEDWRTPIDPVMQHRLLCLRETMAKAKRDLHYQINMLLIRNPNCKGSVSLAQEKARLERELGMGEACVKLPASPKRFFPE